MNVIYAIQDRPAIIIIILHIVSIYRLCKTIAAIFLVSTVQEQEHSICSFMCNFCILLFVPLSFSFGHDLSVLPFTDSDCPFSVFKFFFLAILPLCIRQHFTTKNRIVRIILEHPKLSELSLTITHMYNYVKVFFSICVPLPNWFSNNSIKLYKCYYLMLYFPNYL